MGDLDRKPILKPVQYSKYLHCGTWAEAREFFTSLGFVQNKQVWNWVHPKGGRGVVTNAGKDDNGKWLLTCHAIRGPRVV